MKDWRVIIISLLLATTPLSGVELRIDGTSAEAFDKSMKEMLESLPMAQRLPATIAFSQFTINALSRGGVGAQAIQRRLHGLTAAQLSALDLNKAFSLTENSEEGAPRDDGLLLSTRAELEAKWGQGRETPLDSAKEQTGEELILQFYPKGYCVSAYFLQGKVHAFNAARRTDGAPGELSSGEEIALLQELGGGGWFGDGDRKSKDGFTASLVGTDVWVTTIQYNQHGSDSTERLLASFRVPETVLSEPVSKSDESSERQTAILLSPRNLKGVCKRVVREVRKQGVKTGTSRRGIVNAIARISKSGISLSIEHQNSVEFESGFQNGAGLAEENNAVTLSYTFTPADITAWIDLRKQNKAQTFEEFEKLFSVSWMEVDDRVSFKKRWNSLMILPYSGSPKSSMQGYAMQPMSPDLMKEDCSKSLVDLGMITNGGLVIDFRNGKVVAFLGGSSSIGAAMFE